MLNKIFKKNKNIVIGAVHFPPLLGYQKFPGFKIAYDNALKDIKAFEKGGADAIILENNYDIPHKVKVDPEIIASMTYLISMLKTQTKLPLGISVLWNDYQTALAIAKILDLKFIRVPVFVDKVKTSIGIIQGNAKDVVAYRKKINAENIQIFADIQVKHCTLLNKRPLSSAAREAISKKADALIVTGSWTGDAPDEKMVRELRNKIKNFPILIGSGTDHKNISGLFQYANGTIVSTSLKSGSAKSGEINVKGYGQRIDIKKVKKILTKI